MRREELQLPGKVPDLVLARGRAGGVCFLFDADRPDVREVQQRGVRSCVLLLRVGCACSCSCKKRPFGFGSTDSFGHQADDSL